MEQTKHLHTSTHEREKEETSEGSKRKQLILRLLREMWRSDEPERYPPPFMCTGGQRRDER